MKIRKGFVSNSSSSSFVIGVRGKLTKKKIMKAFKIDNKSPLYSLAEKIADVLRSTTSYTKGEYLEDQWYDEESDLKDIEKKIFDKGFTFYSGSASDDGHGDGGAESALCDMDLDYEDDEIIIYKEAGY